MKVSKRFSTWANLASVIAAAVMTQYQSLGLSPEHAAYVHVVCSIVIGGCQLYKQVES